MTLWVDTDTIWVENPKICCSIPGFCFLQDQTHEYFRTKRKGEKKEEKKGGLCKIEWSRNEKVTFSVTILGIFHKKKKAKNVKLNF